MTPPDRTESTPLGPSTWKSRGKVALKLAATAVVLAFVGRHVARTGRDLAERDLWPRLELSWLLAAVGLYIGGLISFGIFFWRIMADSPTPTACYPAVRAYVISHLAKYVPGKAMVVVLRAALVVPFGARAATAAYATLYETLAMMGAGGLVAASGFGFGSGTGSTIVLGPVSGRMIEVPLSILGFGLAGLFLLVSWPSVFPKLARLARVPNVGPDALPRLSGRLLAEGLAWSGLGWILLGLSQVAVIRGIVPGGLPAASWPLAVASVALATVAGFVVPIAPGGLGVREWVLWTALASAIDRDLAVVAALVLRLAWVAGEVLAAAVLFAARPGRGGVA